MHKDFHNVMQESEQRKGRRGWSAWYFLIKGSRRLAIKLKKARRYENKGVDKTTVFTSKHFFFGNVIFYSSVALTNDISKFGSIAIAL